MNRYCESCNKRTSFYKIYGTNVYKEHQVYKCAICSDQIKILCYLKQYKEFDIIKMKVRIPIVKLNKVIV
jgi:hypothetical protein